MKLALVNLLIPRPPVLVFSQLWSTARWSPLQSMSSPDGVTFDPRTRVYEAGVAPSSGGGSSRSGRIRTDAVRILEETVEIVNILLEPIYYQCA